MNKQCPFCNVEMIRPSMIGPSRKHDLPLLEFTCGSFKKDDSHTCPECRKYYDWECPQCGVLSFYRDKENLK